MAKKLKRLLVLSVGIIFIIFGFIGLLLPFLQGIFFLIIGSILLSFYFPKSRVWIDSHTQKYPHLHAAAKKIEAWMAKLIGEM